MHRDDPGASSLRLRLGALVPGDDLQKALSLPLRFSQPFGRRPRLLDLVTSVVIDEVAGASILLLGYLYSHRANGMMPAPMMSLTTDPPLISTAIPPQVLAPVQEPSTVVSLMA